MTHSADISCRACGWAALEERLTVERWRYGECPVCRSMTLLARVSHEDARARHAAGTYFGEERRKFSLPIEAALEVCERLRARWVAHELVHGARVLDVGCGRGAMAAELARRGFRVWVSELDEEAASGARVRGLSQVLTGPNALQSLAPGSLEAITSFHSLEHFDDPPGFFAQAATLLASNGRLVVEVPLLSRWARRLGAAWFHLDPPRHTVLFTKAGLLALGAQAGFELTASRTFSLEFSAPSLFLSLSRALAGAERLYESAHVTNARPLARAASMGAILAGSATAFVPSLGLSAIGEGDVIRLRFRKRSP